MNTPVLTDDQLRLISATTFSALTAFFTPTKGFFLMLIIMFAFNVVCGMRADGITLVRCRNFSMKKFGNALVELFLYLIIIQVLYSVMKYAGDASEAVILIKTISYVFCYVYVQNSFKNLINAYPGNRAFRIIYHVIRFEFIKAMPSSIGAAIEKLNKDEELRDEHNKKTTV
ncbi:MAG: hypothetical protein LBV32_06355 [Tannerellaceae bacterium]|jgi:hypothetical protein|nr:hypothetical protein [Tannerellaceae bacterium]